MARQVKEEPKHSPDAKRELAIIRSVAMGMTEVEGKQVLAMTWIISSLSGESRQILHGETLERFLTDNAVKDVNALRGRAVIVITDGDRQTVVGLF